MKRLLDAFPRYVAIVLLFNCLLPAVIYHTHCFFTLAFFLRSLSRDIQFSRPPVRRSFFFLRPPSNLLGPKQKQNSGHMVHFAGDVRH